MSFYVYILRCSDDSYYVGHTEDIEARIEIHSKGLGCRWTASRLPITLVWSHDFLTRDSAKSVELQLKKWSRAKKKALIEGNVELLQQLARKVSFNSHNIKN